jgi:hypothetical protein
MDGKSKSDATPYEERIGEERERPQNLARSVQELAHKLF